MKTFNIRKTKIKFPLATLTVEQMATEVDILIDIYGVDPVAAFNLDFVERHLLLEKIREVTGGKLENGDTEGITA